MYSNFAQKGPYTWFALRVAVSKRRGVLLARQDRHPAFIKPANNEFMMLLMFVEERIMNAEKEGITLREHAALRRQENARRVASGLERLPLENRWWQTWATHAERAAVQRLYHAAYTDAMRGKGKRITPFVTREVREALALQERKLLSAIENVERCYTSAFGTPKALPLMWRDALMLKACSDARRALTSKMRSYTISKVDPFSDPLPVDWRHLLDTDMGNRIAAAEVNPQGIDTRDLYTYRLRAEKEATAAMQEFIEAHDRQVMLKRLSDLDGV